MRAIPMADAVGTLQHAWTAAYRALGAVRASRVSTADLLTGRGSTFGAGIDAYRAAKAEADAAAEADARRGFMSRAKAALSPPRKGAADASPAAAGAGAAAVGAGAPAVGAGAAAAAAAAAPLEPAFSAATDDFADATDAPDVGALVEQARAGAPAPMMASAPDTSELVTADNSGYDAAAAAAAAAAPARGGSPARGGGAAAAAPGSDAASYAGGAAVSGASGGGPAVSGGRAREGSPEGSASVAGSEASSKRRSAKDFFKRLKA